MTNLKTAVALIKKWEGFRDKAYQDSGGVWTIGWGTIKYKNGIKVKRGDIITKANAEKELTSHVKNSAVKYVNHYVKVDITDNQFSALVSLMYNIGPGNFKKSLLLKKLNKKDYLGAAQDFKNRNKVNGVPIRGLTRRRTDEEKLFRKGMIVKKEDSKSEKPSESTGWLMAIIDFLISLFTVKKKAKNEIVIITHMPKFNHEGLHVAHLQKALIKAGMSLTVDGEFGVKTRKVVSKFQKSIGLKGTGRLGPVTLKALGLSINRKFIGSPIPWYDEAKKFEGKHERDVAFGKYMVPKWKLVGLSLKDIYHNWSAWCGLAIAVALNNAGLKHQKDGAAAKNWAKFGNGINWKVNGIPKGAIIHINHKGKNSSSGNHVTMAEYSYTAADLSKVRATIKGFGGNQANTWRVSVYNLKTVMAVRWPSEFKLPGKVTKTTDPKVSKASNESTR